MFAYSHLATEKAIPHGVFDCKLNKGYITIGDSYETAAFLIDNLRWWWNKFGENQYPDASHILLLCDCGGANGYRHQLFKVLLQGLATETGIRIAVAHYPPYCSKYNPIERKLFSHVQRTIKNTLLTSLEQVKNGSWDVLVIEILSPLLVSPQATKCVFVGTQTKAFLLFSLKRSKSLKNLMSKTSHSKGLALEVRIVRKNYPLKQRSDKRDINEKKILRHPKLPKLSYTILS